MQEEWRWIKGCEGLYEVSNLGRVRSYWKCGYRGKQDKLSDTPHILKPYSPKGDYESIGLSVHGVGRNFYIHRLVAEAFIPNPDNKPEVDHKDTDKTNNRVDNLRWATKTENQNNHLTRLHNSAAQIGRTLTEEHKKNIGDGVRRSEAYQEFVKRRSRKVLCVETGEIYPSLREAQRRLDMKSLGYYIDKNKEYKGLHYRFLEG